jgi:hypothetical protein
MSKYVLAPFMVIWGIISYLLVEVVIFLPLFILGFPACWWAQSHAEREERPSMLFPERTIICYKNRILDAWLGNWEDGIQPEFEWWSGKSALAWFNRNPVCNLRFLPIISTKPSPNTVFIGTDEIKDDGVPCHFLAWSGGYVGYRYQNTKWGVWFGYKINPRDARYVPADDYRIWGLGTAGQIMIFPPK